MGLRATYDPEVDAAYVYLRDIGPGDAVETIPLLVPSGVMINLDLDAERRLIGLEVIGASGFLPPSLLAEADPPGRRQPDTPLG